MLKGTWMVDDIRFVGEKGIYKAKVFGLADSPCFKGSEWVLIPNNGTGKFTLNNLGQCKGEVQRILWSFDRLDGGKADFLFQAVDSKNKPLANDKSGYVVGIEAVRDSNFEMHIRTSYEGNPFDVVMNLHKVSNAVKL